MTATFAALVLVQGELRGNVPEDEIVRWTEDDQAAAEREGWCLFEVGGGLWELQRDDEGTVFRDDTEALQVVALRADIGRSGTPEGLHARALAIHWLCRYLRLQQRGRGLYEVGAAVTRAPSPARGERRVGPPLGRRQIPSRRDVFDRRDNRGLLDRRKRARQDDRRRAVGPTDYAGRRATD